VVIHGVSELTVAQKTGRKQKSMAANQCLAADDMSAQNMEEINSEINCSWWSFFAGTGASGG